MDPVKVLQFDREGSRVTAVLNKRELTSIFNRDMQDSKVCVISSLGPCGIGKSFLLNYVLRALTAMAANEQDIMGWDDDKKCLDGFEFKKGESRSTKGIWFSTPTMLKSPNNRKIFVIVMDVESILDEYSSSLESTDILQMCLTLSSCSIFSMPYELQKDAIYTLANCMRSLDNVGKVLLLIKDWHASSKEFEFGEFGGKRYMGKKLQIQAGMSEEQVQSRQTLLDNIQEIECFLMPSPGENILTKVSNGCLDDLEGNYLRSLEQLLLNVLNPILEPPAFDTAVTGREFLKRFDEAVKLFNSTSNKDTFTTNNFAGRHSDTGEHNIGSLLPSTSLQAMTFQKQDAVESGEVFMSSCLKRYTDQLDEKLHSEYSTAISTNLLAKDEKDLQKKIQKEFVDHPHKDEFHVIRSLEEKLITSMEEYFQETKYRIEARRKLILDKLDAGFLVAKEQYDESINALFAKKNGTLSSIRKENQKLTNGIMDDFRALTANISHPAANLFYSKLKDHTNSSFQAAEEKFNERASQKQAKHNEYELSLVTEKYVTLMENFIYSSTSASVDKMFEWHNVCAEKVKAEADITITEQIIEERLLAQFNKLKSRSVKNNSTPLIHRKSSDNPEPVTTPEPMDTNDCLDNESCKIGLSVCPDSDYGLPEHTDLHHNLLDSNAGGNINFFLDMYKSGIEEAKNNPFKPEFVETVLRNTKDLVFNQYQDSGSHLSDTTRKSLDDSFKELDSNLHDQLAKIRQQDTQKAEKLLDAFEDMYRERMSKEQPSTEKELKEAHTTITQKLIEEYDFKLCHMTKEELAHLHKKLKDSANKTFEREILFVFNTKTKQKNVRFLDLSQKVRSSYTVLMEKHFKNEPYVHPVAFSSYVHPGILKEALQKCGSLTSKEEAELQKLLEPVFESYKNQNTRNTPVNEPAIGIDLGTTYSCVAIYQNGGVEIIKNELGNNIIPSYVAFTSGGEIIGEAAKEQAHENPSSTIFDAKRLIGRKYTDKEVQDDKALWAFQVVDSGDGIPVIQVGERTYEPEQISAKLLGHIKRMAEAKLKDRKVKHAVITVPAYFNDGQRQATVDAAEIAGLKVLAIINEPTAAAIAFYLHRSDQFEKRNVLVYDLGGGTFDVAIVSMEKGKIDVLSVKGDTHLGGEDFDSAMVDYCVSRFEKANGISLTKDKYSNDNLKKTQVATRLRRIRNVCEARKKELSGAHSTIISVQSVYGNLDLEEKLTRAQFEEMNNKHFEYTIEIVKQALADAKLRSTEIDDVVLVGGSTRIPKIQELLTKFFNGKILSKNVNPDEAVAYGAAVQAAMLNGDREQSLCLNDVTPLSLGVELFDGSNSVIIRRNTRIPVKLTKEYTTAYDNQTAVSFPIYEGENTVSKKNHLLGKFSVKNIPANPRGKEKVNVTMEINSEGILQVTAVSKSGSSNSIQIEENKGRLSKKQKQRLLKEEEELHGRHQ